MRRWLRAVGEWLLEVIALALDAVLREPETPPQVGDDWMFGRWLDERDCWCSRACQ